MLTLELQKELDTYAPALALDRTLSPRFRHGLGKFVFLFIAVLLVLEVFLFLLSGASFLPPSFVFAFLAWAPKVHGLLSLLAALGLVLFMLESFYHSLYFRGIQDNTSRDIKKDANGVTLEVARVLALGRDDAYRDPTRCFVESGHGREILFRCGLSEELQDLFVHQERMPVPTKNVPVPKSGFLTLGVFAEFVFASDGAFSDFLFSRGITKEIYDGAVRWVSRTVEEEKHRRRWWTRDRLSQIPGIGRDFAYGGAYILTRFAVSPTSGGTISLFSHNDPYAEEKVSHIETVLSRTQEANALLIGEEGVGKRDIIRLLEQRIRSGEAPEALHSRRVLIFDTNLFIATYGEKRTFEQALLRMLAEASDAGNVILVIEHFSSFIQSAEALGSDIVALMDPYLASAHLQVLATNDPSNFHNVLESRSQMVQRFEAVSMDGASQSGTIRAIEDVAIVYERKHSIRFTYDAVRAIVESADRYVVSGVMPDKAIDLLIEVVPAANAKDVRLVTSDFVFEYVKEKTGIPVGKVSDEERETLLHLEGILHRRVIGQDAAIDAIANAMRRARAGIQNPDRPIGSFLFLGPTGVGKTETSKALAAVFFGDEEKMVRLDMSEYSAEDALPRLIGSSDGSDVGRLTALLKDHPHGVLLIDEFEKTTMDVKNLFLQILDEGYFSNSRGERIGARNHIIIATSNAGSDLIWEFSQEGKDLNETKDQIIDAIIERGIYRPELLNRFDGVIVFHALSRKHLTQIARILLGGLKKRIKEQGYEIVVNDVLVNLLATEGYDPQFGARPMRRVLQDRIEKQIAEKILEQSLTHGSSIEFTADDFDS